MSFQEVKLFAEAQKFHFNERKMKAERHQGSHTNPLLGQEMDLSISEHSHSCITIIFLELSFSWFNSTFYVHHVAKKNPLKASLRKGMLLDFLLLLAEAYIAGS